MKMLCSKAITYSVEIALRPERKPAKASAPFYKRNACAPRFVARRHALRGPLILIIENARVEKRQMYQSSYLSLIPYHEEPLQNGVAPSYEQHYHQTMIQMRQKNLSSFSAQSKMPFALKQRQIELPMLEYSVSMAQSSPKWRQVIVSALLENIENGPGHLSVHRAKDALKQIASSIGYASLCEMLHSHDLNEAKQAIQLLGWLKNSRAALTLLRTLESDHKLNHLIAAVVEQHYSSYKT